MKLRLPYSFLQKEIDSVEKELEYTIFSEQEMLSTVSKELLQSGGKRIRPIFVLLGGRFGKKDKSQLKYIAVALELIHMASLVHDDVIDNADKRRGMETINTRFGNKAAMYTGDYLFSRALTSMVHMENPKVHQVLSYTILELCRGEIEQIRDKFNFDQGFKC